MGAFVENEKSVYKPISKDYPAWNHEPIPVDLSQLFDQLQGAAFGSRRPLSLKSCASCDAFTDFGSGTIFIQLSFVSKLTMHPSFRNPHEVVAFILAHEIGHVLQGLSIQASSKLDLNGYPSLVTTSFGSDAPEELLHTVFEAHSEVDGYGLLVLKRAGFGRFDDAMAALEMMRISDDKWNVEDIDVREANILSSVAAVWPVI